MREKDYEDDTTPLVGNGTKPATPKEVFCYVHYVIAGMCFTGYTIVYLLRYNLSVAITVMVHGNGVNQTKENTSGEFDWSAKTQQTILGAFFYSYAVMPLPAGYLANRFGGRVLVGVSVLWTSVAGVLVPWAARTDFRVLVFVRILDGIGQSALVPGIYQIVQKWSPQNELTKMLMVTCSGKFAGLILSSITSPWLCSSTFLGGWPLSFYVYSCMGFVWTIIWAVWGSDSPTTYRWELTSEEKQFYNSIPETRKSAKTKSVPWRKIVTSLPVWAIVICNFGHSVGLNLWITNTPTFFTTVFHVDLKECGLITSVAFLVQLILSISLSMFSDWLLSRGYVSNNTLRKGFVIVGICVTSLSTVSIGYANDSLLFVVFICCVGFYTFTTTGIMPMPLDIAPNFSSIISGAMNVTANSAGFVGTWILGALLDEKNAIDEWRQMFMIIAAIQLFGLLFFILAGSAKQQPWANIDENENLETVKITRRP